jgi:hypothetical protein
VHTETGGVPLRRASVACRGSVMAFASLVVAGMV